MGEQQLTAELLPSLMADIGARLERYDDAQADRSSLGVAERHANRKQRVTEPVPDYQQRTGRQRGKSHRHIVTS